MKDKFDVELEVGDKVVYCTRHSSSMTQNYAEVLAVDEDRAKVLPLDKSRRRNYKVDNRTGEEIHWSDLDNHKVVKAHYVGLSGEVITPTEHNDLCREYWRRSNYSTIDKSKTPGYWRYNTGTYADYVEDSFDMAKPVYISTPRYVINLKDHSWN